MPDYNIESIIKECYSKVIIFTDWVMPQEEYYEFYGYITSRQAQDDMYYLNTKNMLNRYNFLFSQKNSLFIPLITIIVIFLITTFLLLFKYFSKLFQYAVSGIVVNFLL
jgi:hypothetical protein